MSCCQSGSCCDNIVATSKAGFKAALVGNPNCGKTTLFNSLTGARQRVGNWPGVTVERKSGSFTYHHKSVETIDLPGVYSLTLACETSAVDERIACEYILAGEANVVVNIVNASNLERHLYLTTQLIEMGAPVIVALNMMDVARKRRIKVDLDKLSNLLGCPVVAVEANKGQGVTEVKRAIAEYQPRNQSVRIPYPQAIQQAITELSEQTGQSEWVSARLIEGDACVCGQVTEEVLAQANVQQANVQTAMQEDADILLADARYQFVNQLVAECVLRDVNVPSSWTSRIDNIVLNRVLGLPIFLGVMYALFFFSIVIGGAFQDLFDISSQTIFVDGFAVLLNSIGSPTWLTVLLANGIGKGINTTITFIPVIGAMFLFLALLEDSGYMARAAFVVDRFMRALGLPGKAFVPMIVGFGCNVPSVMGARTLENKRDRILTIMMAPFMSCGARLAIFAVFTAAFFPQGGQNVIFALYLIGIAMAVLTGFILQTSMLKGEPSPLVMELPTYHFPSLKTLFIHAWQRLRGFVDRAGRYIVPICVLIGALNSLNIDGTMNAGDGDAHSVLSWIGQYATIIFQPMGLSPDNWPATVGLVTGVLAKEVVVGTLNTLYSQVGHLAAAGADSFSFIAGMKSALYSVPENLSHIGSAFSNPILASAPMDDVNQGVYGLMYQKFDGKAGAFAYLLFVLLYFPCVSTTAAIVRELHRGWAVFSALWMAGVAYATAVVFYQAAIWSRHPWSSSLWIAGMVGAFFTTIFAIRWYAGRARKAVNVADMEAAGGRV